VVVLLAAVPWRTKLPKQLVRLYGNYDGLL
jgi:hypothetical protein